MRLVSKLIAPTKSQMVAAVLSTVCVGGSDNNDRQSGLFGMVSTTMCSIHTLLFVHQGREFYVHKHNHMLSKQSISPQLHQSRSVFGFRKNTETVSVLKVALNTVDKCLPSGLYLELNNVIRTLWRVFTELMCGRINRAVMQTEIPQQLQHNPMHSFSRCTFVSMTCVSNGQLQFVVITKH